MDTSTKRRVDRPGRPATVEGYLAPVFLVILILLSSVVRLPAPFGFLVGVTVWSCCWLFSISGVRHGLADARWAAGLTLACLIGHAAISLRLAYH